MINKLSNGNVDISKCCYICVHGTDEFVCIFEEILCPVMNQYVGAMNTCEYFEENYFDSLKEYE